MIPKSNRWRWVWVIALIISGTVNAMYCPQAGRFLQQDLLGYIDGMSMYEYVQGKPELFTDPNGTDIYLQKGGGTNPINNLIHMAICVDLWRCCDGSSIGDQKMGKECFSFRLTHAGPAAPSSTWLGFPFPHFELGLLVPKGTIYVQGLEVDGVGEGKVSGFVINSKKTKCMEDRKWRKYMEKERVGVSDVYHAALNCVTYSTLEFSVAPWGL